MKKKDLKKALVRLSTENMLLCESLKAYEEKELTQKRHNLINYWHQISDTNQVSHITKEMYKALYCSETQTAAVLSLKTKIEELNSFPVAWNEWGEFGSFTFITVEEAHKRFS